MEQLYKSILHSKRANIYYLEHCRVLVNGGRVEYITENEKESLYWNIPIANTTCILLGSGTSITQAAMRELASAGVMLGFCGGNGTPLYAGTNIEWLSPQNEYRPTEYLQKWCKSWFNDDWRLKAAKTLQSKRLDNVEKYWKQHDWEVDLEAIKELYSQYKEEIQNILSIQALLAAEGRMAKSLYKLAVSASHYYDKNFSRKYENAKDKANIFLNHGNYLAYGLSASALWVLGLPHGLAILHGKTRRGGLVFDIADLIKDIIILPLAFICAEKGFSSSEFRITCTDAFIKYSAMDLMIDTVKELAEIE